MKKIAIFCIPAHGHTNPMLPVAKALVQRGNTVRFYSFHEFEEKIKATGVEFVSCDKFVPQLTQEEEQKLKEVSTTEMSIQDIRITLKMNDFLEQEFQTFQPDVVYTDSVCFWGKLNAWKYHVPMVVSTSTFAFNQLSSQYMKYSRKELSDMILGLPKISKELKTLEPYGYHVKNTLSLIQNDNNTDSVVYTSKKFQPYAESFSNHYAFVGPSVFSKAQPEKEHEKPLVYISMGTVINERPDFYNKCIDALKDLEADILISCGKTMDISLLGTLPENVKVYPYVNQLDILSKANVFITHCGMNSVSESLYMATPMVLYPQTNEQYAVARRVSEGGAGVILTDDSVSGIKNTVKKILDNTDYAENAMEYCKDFRSCGGAEKAAEFIENAPHTSNGIDVFQELNKTKRIFQIIYWLIVILILVLVGCFFGTKFLWIIGIATGICFYPVGKVFQNRKYQAIVKKQKEQQNVSDSVQ